MKTATMATPGHLGTPDRQAEELHISTTMQRWSRSQHRLVSKRMGKFKDLNLLSAIFTAFQLALGLVPLILCPCFPQLQMLEILDANHRQNASHEGQYTRGQHQREMKLNKEDEARKMSLVKIEVRPPRSKFLHGWTRASAYTFC